jgi:hypothetical protein
MDEPQEAQFVCSVCHTAFTQRDIDHGLAAIRHGEVLCIEHFEEKYPDECVNHPGSKATEKCDQCGRMVCKDCIIELAGETACPKCKPVRMAEIFTGRQIEPPGARKHRHIPIERTKEYIKHLVHEKKKEEYRQMLSPAPGGGEVDAIRIMFYGAILSIFIPFVGIPVIVTYRNKLKVLFDKGYIEGAVKARIAYFIAIATTVFWSAAVPVILILNFTL